ncbi:helix-turn-helix domain-containing protein [Ammoniphilus sp. CFH 90114]|uniref:helix-turn-helix domain-containing protein n=1 Tax=Ammoniphilus sp. CFH 90114 TaxID=2493665 RepID=UPI00100E18D0|nr:helix-turn-helix transcriptional regulator [Ammoniphilus sp. CFH 90114]RXT02876.1 XRE family transcriptional regulator [Ammoniphilus sp. CFH 90114]
MHARAFGDFLRESRLQQKLSIRKLERLSGVSNAYISQIENGNRGIPSPEILRKIAEPLGLSYEELLEKAGYVDTPTSDSMDLEEVFKNISITFKGRELNDHQKNSMLNFVKTLIEMSEEDS